ncbi:MAG: hypothetical protein HN337_05425 [Deltaproteobacteria bacterium]|nr:hypothetical protein [Deltaproteobacteria bacterium]
MPGTVIQLDVSNYTSDYEVVFGSSAVQMINMGALSISDIPTSETKTEIEIAADGSTQDENLPIDELSADDSQAGAEDAPLQPPSTSGKFSITVPDTSSPGKIEIFLSNGKMKTYSKHFNVLSSNGIQASPSESVGGDYKNPFGTTDSTLNEGEEQAETSASLTGCYCGDFNNDDHPDWIPSDLQCSDSVGACANAVREGAFVINWDLSNVKAAYVEMRTGDQENYKASGTGAVTHKRPFSYMKFFGDPAKPYLGIKADEYINVGTALLEDPLANFGDLGSTYNNKIINNPLAYPFNYCLYGEAGGTDAEDSAARCFSTKQENVTADIVNIFIPLLPDENTSSGSWAIRLKEKVTDSSKGGSGTSFTLYYKTWADELLHKTVESPVLSK